MSGRCDRGAYASTIETLAKRSVGVRDREPTGLSRLSLYRLTVESIDVA